MKNYQDSDPLHGNGKAMPHPKRPNNTVRATNWRITNRRNQGTPYIKSN